MNKMKKLFSTLPTLLLAGSTCLAASDAGIPSFSPTQPDGTDFVGDMLGVIQWIGIIVGVVMIIWVGIKYLMAGAGEKAKAKETLVPMLVGAALVILAPTIMNTVYGFFSGK